MRLHTALFATVMVASSPLALADPISPDVAACAGVAPASAPPASCAAQPPASRSVVILLPGHDVLGDVHGARGPGVHARELREIAVAAATGNHEKAERVTKELHQFGVSRVAVREFIDQAKLHTGSTRPAKRRFFVTPSDGPEVEPGWENSQ